MGGHGGLNILPQKRWNVYNWDNRERVRKDEEEAARQEQQQQQQAQEREAEVRLNRLRDNARARARAGSNDRDGDVRARAGSNDRDGDARARAGSKDHDGDDDRQVLSAASPVSPHKHHFLNLFEELEAREQQEAKEKAADGSNVERHFKRQKKQEVSAEDEKYRLGYGSSGKQPWYMSSARLLDDTKQQQPHGLIAGASKRSKVARKSMEELRAERLKREEEERAKARQLVRGRRPSSPSSKQQRHYNAGYGNARP